MAKIKNTTAYPTVTPNASDLLIATDVSDNNKTVTFLVSDLLAAGTVLQDLQSVLTTGDTAIEDINLTGTIDLTGTLELDASTQITVNGSFGTAGQVLVVNATATGLEYSSASGLQTWDETVAQGNTVTGRVLNADDSSMNFTNTALTLGSLTGSEYTSFLWAGPAAINNNLDLGDPTGTNAYAVNFYSKQQLTVDGTFGLAGEFLAVNAAADGLEWSAAPTNTTPTFQEVLTAGNVALMQGFSMTGDGTGTGGSNINLDVESRIISQGNNSFNGNNQFAGLGTGQTDAAITIDTGSRIYLGNNVTGSSGTAGQVLAINAAGNAMEWSSTAAGTQDLQSVLNNGGTADAVGTNLANIYLTGNGDATASATNGLLTVESGSLSLEDTELFLDGDVGTAGQVLISGGANAGPSWSNAGTGTGTVESVSVTDSTYLDLSVSNPTDFPDVTASLITNGLAGGLATEYYDGSGAFSVPVGSDWNLSFSKTGTPASASNLSSTGSTGYVTATGVGTQSSSGSGLLVNITAVAGEVTVIDALGGSPTGYSVGDVITVIQGGSSDDATFEIASVTTNTVGLTNTDGTRSSTVNIDAGSNIAMTVDASNDLTLSSSAGGGSVSSVALTSTNLTVTGSPITTSGTLTVEIPTSGVVAGSYTSANVTVSDRGIVTAISNGSTDYQLGAGPGITNSIISQGNTGTNYTPGIYQTTSSGNGRGFTVNVVSVGGNGDITAFSTVQSGSGYVDSEVITVTGGDGNATFAVGTVPVANQIVLSGNGTDDVVTLTGTGGTTITTTANGITIDSATASGLTSFGIATDPTSNTGTIDVTNNTLTFTEQINTIDTVDYRYIGLDISGTNILTAGLTASTAGLDGTTVSQSYLRADNTWAIPPNTEYSVFSGAASTPLPNGTNGTVGLVPQPLAASNDYNKFLKGDGTWGTPSGSGTLTGVSVTAPLTVDSTTDPAIPALNINDFTGPDVSTSTNGSKGTVPTPLVADDGKFLSTAGWTTAPGQVYTSTDPIDINATTNVVSLNYNDSPNNLIMTAADALITGWSDEGYMLISKNSSQFPNDDVTRLTLNSVAKSVIYNSGIEVTDNTTTANVQIGKNFPNYLGNTPKGKIKFVDSAGIDVTVTSPTSPSIDPIINFGLSAFTGPTATAAGTIGAVPAPLSSYFGTGRFLKVDGTWEVNNSYFAWKFGSDGTQSLGVLDGVAVNWVGGTGVTTSATAPAGFNPGKVTINLDDFTAPDVPGGNPGLKGAVPAPQVADDGKFLSTAGWTTMAGGGTVTSVSGTLPIQVDNTTNPAIPAVSVNTFTGATSAPADGTKGAVPAPLAASQDYDKFLKGDGTWSTVTTSFSFDISDNVPATQTITDGNTITFSGGTDITSAVSATDTVTFSHDTITRTDTASTATPGQGGSFSVIKDITSSAQGHITAADVVTVTLPNSDDYQDWTLAGDQGNNHTISSNDTVTMNGFGGITVALTSNPTPDAVNISLQAFSGASSGTNGVAGGVPIPLGQGLNTDYDKFLKGDGTWATPATSYSWSADADNSAGVSINDAGQVKWVGGVGVNTTIATGSPNTITTDLDVSKLTQSTVTGNDFIAGEETTTNTTVKFKISDLPFTNNSGTVSSVGITADNAAGTGITTTGSFTFSGGTLITTSVTGNTVTFNQSTVTRTNSTSSSSIVVGGNFTAIDSITSNGTGHITAVNTKTVTLPSAYQGATNSADGVSGFVPQPISSTDDQTKYLKGDGTWSLDGLVTSIVAGTGITVSGATGNVTVNAANNGTVTSVNLTGNTGTGSAITSSGTFDIDGITSASAGATTDHFNGISTTASGFNLDIKGFAIPDENEYWVYRANDQTGSSAMGLEKSILYGYDDTYKSLAIANNEVAKEGYTLVLGASKNSRAYIFNAGNTTYRWSNVDAAGTTDSSTNSIFIGANAGAAAASNTDNIGIGSNALLASTNGASNIALGTDSGKALLAGARNILIGKSAGQSLAAADDNIAIGELSLSTANSADADQNIALGKNTLSTLTSGARNIAIGHQALADGVLVQTDNIFMGYQAGMESFGGADIGIGYQALIYGSNSTPNVGTNEETARVAIGYKALAGGSGTAVQGVGNVALGGHAGEFNATSVVGGAVYVGYYAGNNTNGITTAGFGQVAIGYNAMKFTVPSQSIAIGYLAMEDAASPTIGGESHVAIGKGAMRTATVTGNNNIAIGTDANTNTVNVVSAVISLGYQSKAKGSCTIAIGCQASAGDGAASTDSIAIGNDANTAGTKSISIGRNASTTGAQSISLGDNAQVIDDYSVAIGAGASTNAANQLAFGTAAQNLGSIVTQTITPNKTWEVRINGVNYLIPIVAAP